MVLNQEGRFFESYGQMDMAGNLIVCAHLLEFSQLQKGRVL